MSFFIMTTMVLGRRLFEIVSGLVRRRANIKKVEM